MVRVLTSVVLGLLLAGCAPPVDSDTDAAADSDPDSGTEGGWVHLQPGLDIRDTVEGDGVVVAVGDVITVHYTIWLFENNEIGGVIQSSTAGEPFTSAIGVGAVIDGWDLGIPGMREGGTRELIIGPDLAYGPDPQGPIPGNSTLFFEVTVVKVF